MRSRTPVLLALAFAAAACTPATEDLPAGSGGAGPGASGGAGGSGGSGGSGDAGDASQGGATGAGGSTSAGTGGAIAAGGSSGAGGGSDAAGTGGVSPAGGCNWTTAADGSLMFAPPPGSKVVLFDGTSLDQWRSETGGAAQWKLIGDGTMEVVPLEPPTDMQTKMKFEDLCVHVEYLTPMYPSSVGGQDRGNSGVYLKSAYEMQILDSYGKPPAIDTCGAVYSVRAPMLVACNMQLVWNTYEIEFRASVWDASGKKTKNAVFVQSVLNGKLVQKNVDLNVAMTIAGNPDLPGPQPLMLQDHRNLVRFRNIWVTVPRY